MKRYEGPDSSGGSEGNVDASDADTLPFPLPDAASTALPSHLRARWAAGHAQKTAAWYRQRADRLAFLIETDARILQQQQAQLDEAFAYLGHELRGHTRAGASTEETWQQKRDL